MSLRRREESFPFVPGFLAELRDKYEVKGRFFQVRYIQKRDFQVFSEQSLSHSNRLAWMVVLCLLPVSGCANFTVQTPTSGQEFAREHQDGQGHLDYEQGKAGS